MVNSLQTKQGIIGHKRRGESACQKYLKRQHENVESKLDCSECDYKTSSKVNLRTHFIKHTNKYHCKQCNLNYGRKYDLLNHLKKNHPEMPEAESHSKYSEKLFLVADGSWPLSDMS